MSQRKDPGSAQRARNQLAAYYDMEAKNNDNLADFTKRDIKVNPRTVGKEPEPGYRYRQRAGVARHRATVARRIVKED